MSKVCQLEHVIVEGLDGLTLSNKLISLTVLPELGGKITSLTYLPAQKEWLWRNPHLPYRPPVYGASYVDQFDLGGLDECFPTVSPDYFPVAPWAGIPIPDHGELWGLPWEAEIVESSPQQLVLAMACYGVRLPYRFERRLTVQAGQSVIRLAYRVTNLSPFPLPFIWSIHPLLKIEAGMRLLLPQGISQVRLNSSTDDFLGKLGAIQPWPLAMDEAGQTLDLSEIQPYSFGRAVKLFTLPLSGGEPVETTLTDAQGERSFSFRFRPSEISNIGVWMNYGAWAGVGSEPYYNLGLEPCLGGVDSLSVAVNQWREACILGPKQARSWSLEIILG